MRRQGRGARSAGLHAGSCRHRAPSGKRGARASPYRLGPSPPLSPRAVSCPAPAPPTKPPGSEAPHALRARRPRLAVALRVACRRLPPRRRAGRRGMRAATRRARATAEARPRLAERIQAVAVRGPELLVAVNDPAWASQVAWLEAQLLERIERLVGPGRITSVRVRVERRAGP